MITWIIEWIKTTSVSTNPAEQVVQAGWRCNGSQEFDGKTYRSTVYGSADFIYTEGASFTPFNELTEEQVIEWVWSNGANKDEIEANVQRQIDEQLNPPIIQQPLPWV